MGTDDHGGGRVGGRTPRACLPLLMMPAALAIAAPAAAQATASATPSYTTAQARAGETAYEAACIACHVHGLGDSGEAPALRGPAFARRWDGRPVAELTGFLREHMPRSNPGLLNDRTYLALVAYLLAMNGMPAGGAPLTLEAAGTIRIAPR